MESYSRYIARDLVSEPFHDSVLLREIWGESWGVPNDIGKIKKVLMHRPGPEIELLNRDAKQIESSAVLVGEVVGRTGEDLEKQELPNIDILKQQHDNLTKVLSNEGIEIVFLEGNHKIWPERIFTRDLGTVIPGGVILSRPALYMRYGEIRLASETFNNIGMPILGCIQGNGFIEGGSFTMLDESTAVIGRSERVNLAGIEQLKFILSIQNINLLIVDLPASIIHLDEAFLLIDRHKALINKSLLPFWFLDELHKREIIMIHIDPKDPPLTINVLPVSPGKVVFPSCGERTMELLQKKGVDIIPVEVSEFYKLGGGIHCLTLPLIRDAI